MNRGIKMDDKKKHTLGDAPIEMSMESAMNSMAFAIDRIFNGEQVLTDTKNAKRANGFVLLVFPFGDKSGRCNYISNGANREDIVRLFKEQIIRFEETIAKEQSDAPGSTEGA